MLNNMSHIQRRTCQRSHPTGSKSIQAVFDACSRISSASLQYLWKQQSRSQSTWCLSILCWIIPGNSHVEHFKSSLHSGLATLEQCVHLALPKEVLDLVSVLLFCNKGIKLMKNPTDMYQQRCFGPNVGCTPWIGQDFPMLPAEVFP